MTKWMFRNIISLGLSLAVVSACKQSEIKEVPPNFEIYGNYLNALISNYQDDNLNEVVSLSEQDFKLPLDIPNYEPYVFKAVKFIEAEEYTNARGILKNYALMLKIDEGQIECDVVNERLVDEKGRILNNETVYAEMCWEMALSNYGVSNPELEAQRKVLKAIALDMSRKVESK